jgi:hypothetical protein
MFLGFFDFHFCASRAKSRSLIPHFLLPPPLLNKHMRKDLTPEDCHLVLDYGLSKGIVNVVYKIC